MISSETKAALIHNRHHDNRCFESANAPTQSRYHARMDESPRLEKNTNFKKISNEFQPFRLKFS